MCGSLGITIFGGLFDPRPSNAQSGRHGVDVVRGKTDCRFGTQSLGNFVYNAEFKVYTAASAGQ